MNVTPEQIAAAYSAVPQRTATISRSIMKGQPRQVSRVVVIDTDEDTLYYTTDGVWYSTASRNEIEDWQLDGWVSIVFMTGDDYDEAVDSINDNGGSTGAAVEYLAQWDYGSENDDAQTREEAPWGNEDTIHIENFGGLEYVLSINHRLGYYGLQRRPLI